MSVTIVFGAGGDLCYICWLVLHAGLDDHFVDALPTALVKPFAGSAARAMLIETMHHSGVDSFPALLAATMQAVPKRPSSWLRCTTERRASVGCAIPSAVLCWPIWPGCWRRLACATGFSVSPVRGRMACGRSVWRLLVECTARSPRCFRSRLASSKRYGMRTGFVDIDRHIPRVVQWHLRR